MALARLYRVIQDSAGNVVPGVATTVTLAGTQTLAQLYADQGGLVGLPNPLTNDPTYGSLTMFLDSGLYDLRPNKAGYAFQPQLSVSAAVVRSGSFVTSATGFVGVMQGDVFYAQQGSSVVITLPELVGTSNANVFALTNWPADLMPLHYTMCPVAINNNGIGEIGAVQIYLPNVVEVMRVEGGGWNQASWTPSGQKILMACSLSYQVA